MARADQTDVGRGEFDRLVSRVAQHDGACVSTRDWMRLTERERQGMREDLEDLRTGMRALGLAVAFLLGVGVALGVLLLGGR